MEKNLLAHEKPQCQYCKEFSRLKKYYRNKNKHQTNFVEEHNNEQHLFHASKESPNGEGNWYLDSGCINDMTKDQSIVKEINKFVNVKV